MWKADNSVKFGFYLIPLLTISPPCVIVKTFRWSGIIRPLDSPNLRQNRRGVPLVFELILRQNGGTLLENWTQVLLLSGIIRCIAARASFSLHPGSAQDFPSSRHPV